MVKRITRNESIDNVNDILVMFFVALDNMIYFSKMRSSSMVSVLPSALLTFASRCDLANIGAYFGSSFSRKQLGMHSMTASGLGL